MNYIYPLETFSLFLFLVSNCFLFFFPPSTQYILLFGLQHQSLSNSLVLIVCSLIVPAGSKGKTLVRARAPPKSTSRVVSSDSEAETAAPIEQDETTCSIFLTLVQSP